MMSSIELHIYRGEYQPDQTLGEFKLIKGKKELLTGVTLEPAWNENQNGISCIPKGKYWAEERESASSRFRYRHFHITNVPGRKWILGHIGNYYFQTEGCILFGSSLADINQDGRLDVVNSRKTFEKLIELTPNRFKVVIHGEF